MFVFVMLILENVLRLVIFVDAFKLLGVFGLWLAVALGLENLYGRELEGQQQLLRMCSE